MWTRSFPAVVSLAFAFTTATAGDMSTLKLVPVQANLVIQFENPRTAVETFLNHDVTKQTLQLPFVRRQLETPDFEKFLYLIEYYEKDLGAKWPEMIEKLAGGGLTISAKAGGDNAPLLIFFHGTDEAFTKRFLELLLDVVAKEQERTEAKERTKTATYRGVQAWGLDKNALLTRLGRTLVFANNNDAMKAVIDLHVAGGKSLADKADVAEARKSLPADCHAWLWLDLDIARQSKEAKEQFSFPANDPLQVTILGGWANTVIRSKYLCGALYQAGDDYTLSFRLNAGRDGMPEALALHVPPKGQTGSLPLLQPKGTLYSQSFYYDIAALWEKRRLLFNEKIAKSFEDSEKQVAPFLPGTSLSKILTQAGAHHRVVVVSHVNKGYQTKPSQIFPAGAFVTKMRDPKFARSFEGVLRAAALAATTQFQMRMNDEMHGDVKIVYYRFDEKAKVDGDPNNTRFNFTPCFATLNDQFIVCSNVELCRELIDLLKIEYRSSVHENSPAAFRGRFYSAGGADLLKSFEDQLLAELMLSQAVPPDRAKKQAEQIMQFARGIGELHLQADYGVNETRLEAIWKRPAIGKERKIQK
jgi:hypothetical protein